MHFPFRKEPIARQDIEKIEIFDEFFRGHRTQQIHLFLAEKEKPTPLSLRDALPLYQALKKWQGLKGRDCQNSLYKIENPMKPYQTQLDPSLEKPNKPSKRRGSPSNPPPGLLINATT